MRRATAALRDRVARTTAARDERAIAVVWMAITLLVMVLFAGFAVDLSNWYYRAERIQRAADSGAHAGVVFLPGDLSSASTTARNAVSLNGYPVQPGTTVTVTQEPNPNRLRVKVTTTVDNYFLSVIGLDTQVITRDAVAEYVAPVPMGSPQNKLGNDPDNADPGTQLWVNVGAPQTGKQQGDRYQARVCDGSPREFGCASTTNSEYATDGYFFAMDVKSVVSGQPLNFEVYDSAWVNVGFTCNTNMPTSGQITGSGFTALTTKFADAATRYGGTQPTRYCAGDGHPGTNPMNTTFIFRGPDNTPWSNVDNPVISTTSCRSTTVAGFNPSSAGTPSRAIYDQLMGATTGLINATDGVVSFAEGFMRWTRLCQIPAGSVSTGKYIVQVRTNVTAANPLDYSTSVSTSGHNHMSFRAGFGTTGIQNVDGAAVTLAALGRLPIFANSAGADTRFYMARVLPYDAGRTLRISLFDMGEGSQPGTLTILPPPEFATTFSGCAITRDDGASLSVNSSTCTLSNVSSSTYNGRLLTIDVPIPTNYTCTQSSATGCWIKIKAAYPSGSTVNDATTWSAAILGNPIRLVE